MEVAVENLNRTALSLKEAAEQFIAALQVLGGNSIKGIPSLLGPKRTRTMPAIHNFVAEKHFCDDDTVDGVKIYLTSESFKKNFRRVVEKDVPSTAICVRKLRKGAYGESVHKELGVPQGIALSHFWELLKNRSRPFFVVLCHGKFICAHWRQDREGWSIDVFPVTGRLLMMYTGDFVVTG